jgi:hypothetical protein
LSKENGYLSMPVAPLKCAEIIKSAHRTSSLENEGF